jgi:hypothetical protein
MGSIWKVCACTKFIPVDERDHARMQFLRHYGNRHDCGRTGHFSVMNCSSTGSFYEREFSPRCPLVHKNRVHIWFISRWPFTNGHAPFTNGQFGQMGTNNYIILHNKGWLYDLIMQTNWINWWSWASPHFYFSLEVKNYVETSPALRRNSSAFHLLTRVVSESISHNSINNKNHENHFS